MVGYFHFQFSGVSAIGTMLMQSTGQGATHSSQPVHSEGRMTGGGSIFTESGTRVTHGFELHCDIDVGPNNLQVNFDGNSFHLESLTAVNCYDDPALNPLPRVVPYSGAKAALNAMTVSLAHEYGPKVRVNTLSAGPFLTDIAKAWTEEAREHADNALGRPGRRRIDLADAVDHDVFPGPALGLSLEFALGLILHPDLLSGIETLVQCSRPRCQRSSWLFSRFMPASMARPSAASSLRTRGSLAICANARAFGPPRPPPHAPQS